MKIHLRMNIGSGLLVLICLLTFLGSNPAYGLDSDGVKKILVLPPKLHAAQDMDFLRKGIVDMLAGRLTTPGSFAVLTLDASQASAPADDVAAAALGRKMGAEYVVLESVVILGDSVSTDARVLETATGKTALTFSRAGQSQADIIAHVDQLAAQINSRLVGRSVAAPADQAVVPAQGDPQPAERSADIHRHPEKLITGLESNQSDRLREFGDESTTASVQLLLRGSRMDMQVRGVTAGDVDGDGALEIVCIDSRTLLTFKIQQGRLVKMARTKMGAANVAVDAADINGNGVDELFITHFDNTEGKLLSYVLEWDGKQFQRIADNLRWYFRSVDMARRGRVLVGQRQGIEDRFVPGIYEIEYTAGTYDGVQKLTLPRDRNVFGFAQGAVRNLGNPDIVDYSRSGYLRVRDSKGREEWTSIESFGGTVNALNVKSKDDPKEQDTFYMPSRVQMVDLDGDGLKEIVAVRNEDSASAFSRIRLFKQGRLEILKWDRLGLMPIWRTRGTTKFIGDFSLADVNGDGKPEIVAAVVQKTRNVISAGSSYLAVFSLDNLRAGDN